MSRKGGVVYRSVGADSPSTPTVVRHPCLLRSRATRKASEASCPAAYRREILWMKDFGMYGTELVMVLYAHVYVSLPSRLPLLTFVVYYV
jgi:hypothetical protein